MFIIPARAKYSDRRPRIANTFDVYTIKELVVMAKMAGIESTAKTRSVVSTTMRTMNSSVAYRFPSFLMKKRSQ